MPDASSNAVNGAPAGGENSSSTNATVMGVPLARWAVIAISAIFVCYTAGSYSIKLYRDWLASHLDESAYSDAITKEMRAHEDGGDKGLQTFVLFTDPNGSQTTATYFSDGCIAINRPGPHLPYLPPSSPEWSLGPGRRPKTSPPAKPTPVWNGSVASEGAGVETSAGAALIDDSDPEERMLRQFRATPYGRSEFQSSQAGLWGDLQLEPMQGSCVNPHQGPFTNWWGPANGCWAPMWRKWRDGCTHYQMYNTCSGQWDPQVHWTFCAAQHFY